MNEQNLIGYNAKKIVYRGRDIFTLFLVKEGCTLGVNFIHCFSLEENGIIGKTITASIETSLDIQRIFICQKLKLNKDHFKLYRIKAISKYDEEFALVAACKEIKVSSNIHLYNPI